MELKVDESNAEELQIANDYSGIKKRLKKVGIFMIVVGALMVLFMGYSVYFLSVILPSRYPGGTVPRVGILMDTYMLISGAFVLLGGLLLAMKPLASMTLRIAFAGYVLICLVVIILAVSFISNLWFSPGDTIMLRFVEGAVTFMFAVGSCLLMWRGFKILEIGGKLKN